MLIIQNITLAICVIGWLLTTYYLTKQMNLLSKDIESLWRIEDSNIGLDQSVLNRLKELEDEVKMKNE